jgi:hypothetical protein
MFVYNLQKVYLFSTTNTWRVIQFAVWFRTVDFTVILKKQLSILRCSNEDGFVLMQMLW